MIGVYKITSPSGRVYIGQSRNVKRRFKDYLSLDSKTKAQTKLWRSFIKYGVESHTFEIIEECLFEEMNIRERYWQDHYDVLNGGLNCVLVETDILPRVFLKGRVTRSKRGKNKNLSKLIGKKQTTEHITNKVKSREGYCHSEDTKQRMSLNSSKLVLDMMTGIFFNSPLEASIAYRMNRQTLTAMLNGTAKNKTNLKYV